jgi:hypothetical protein
MEFQETANDELKLYNFIISNYRFDVGLLKSGPNAIVKLIGVGNLSVRLV